jgi:hypothetical protein
MKTTLAWTMWVAAALAGPAYAKSQTGPMVFFGIVALVILVLPVVFFWLAGRARAKAVAAQHWATTEGTVTALTVDHVRTKGNSWYTPVIAYRFQVGRQEVTGKRLRFGRMAFRDDAQAEALLLGYRVGGPITVRYDADRPSDNVITPIAETKTLMFAAWALTATAIVFGGVVVLALLNK